MSITASPSTSVGLQVFANVNLSGGASPTGTVTFKLFGPTDPSCVSAIYTSTVPSGQSINSNRYTTTTAGTYRWQATYNGDANNTAVGPTACSTPSAAVNVAKFTTALSVAAPAPAGGMIHANVNLNGYGPTGNLSVFLTPPNDSYCNGPPAFTTTVPVNGSGSYSSAGYTPTVSGTYRWRATYSGDANNNALPISGCLDPNAAVTVTVNSSSPAISFTPSSVGFAPQTVATTSPTQNVTVSNPGSAALNIGSMSVTGTNAGEFHLNAGTCGATLAPGGACNLSVSFAPTAPGARNANLAVTDDAAGSPHSVALAGTGTTASPSLSVAGSPSTTVGLQVSATSSLSGGSNPTGTVTFKLFGPTDTACGSALSTSTVAVSGPSASSAGYATSAAGTYRWQATYNGDANNAAVGPTACSTPSAAVNVAPATSAISVSAPPPTAGTIHANVNLSGYNPNGIVTVSLAGPADTACSAQPVFTTTIAVNGSGVYSSAGYTPTVSGTYRWRAAYGGDANNTAAPITACANPNAAVTVTMAASQASFAYPHDGQTGVDSTKPFTWTPAPGAQSYVLIVGVTMYRADLVNSGSLPAGQSMFHVPDLPTGRTLYATLFTQLNGTWSYQAISFTAAASQASFTNPLNGQANVDTAQPFTWSTSPGAQAYLLAIGTAPNTADVFNSGVLPPSQSAFSVGALPKGRTLYGLLFTEVNGAWTRLQVIGFTAR
jgi:hypothetical protein